MDLNLKVCQNKNIPTAMIDDELGMMNISKGNYYATNEMGKEIWELMDEPIQVKEIVEKLLEEYDVEASVCEKEVTDYIHHLLDEGLVEKH